MFSIWNFLCLAYGKFWAGDNPTEPVNHASVSILIYETGRRQRQTEGQKRDRERERQQMNTQEEGQMK